MSDLKKTRGSSFQEIIQSFSGQRAAVGRIKTGIAYLFLFSVFAVAYVWFAPNIFQQDWDSLMYAYWCEVKGISSIWGNHPLGHVIMNSTYVTIRNLGYIGKALPIFIALNSVIGGVAVAFLFSLMRFMKIDPLQSLGYAIIFGGSYSVWHYAGSADVYSLSILLLILSWMALIYEFLIRKHRYAYIAGSLAGLGVLSHQLNAVFFLGALIVFLSQRKDRWTRIVTFYGVSGVVIVVGLIVFGYLAIDAFSVTAIYDWIRGYLGDPIYGNFLNLESLPVAWRTALGTILVPTYGRARWIRVGIYLLFLSAIVMGLTQTRLLDREKKVVLLAALAQCFISWLLIIWFEPWYPKFWLLTLVPSMIVLACCMHAMEKRFTLWFHDFSKYYAPSLAILGLLIVAFNMRYAILNEHRPDKISQASMNSWLQHSDPGDMLITAGDLIPQLWFWADRPDTIHLYHYLVVDRHSDDRFAYLRAQIKQRLCRGESVLFAPAIVDNFGESFLSWLDLSREDLHMFFNAYEKEKLFTYRSQAGIETQVYRLVGSNPCGS